MIYNIIFDKNQEIRVKSEQNDTIMDTKFKVNDNENIFICYFYLENPDNIEKYKYSIGENLYMREYMYTHLHTYIRDHPSSSNVPFSDDIVDLESIGDFVSILKENRRNINDTYIGFKIPDTTLIYKLLQDVKNKKSRYCINPSPYYSNKLKNRIYIYELLRNEKNFRLNHIKPKNKEIIFHNLPNFSSTVCINETNGNGSPCFVMHLADKFSEFKYKVYFENLLILSILNNEPINIYINIENGEHGGLQKYIISNSNELGFMISFLFNGNDPLIKFPVKDIDKDDIYSWIIKDAQKGNVYTVDYSCSDQEFIIKRNGKNFNLKDLDFLNRLKEDDTESETKVSIAEPIENLTYLDGGISPIRPASIIDILSNFYSNNTDTYISWKQCFLGIAFVASMRSKDPVRKVGAVIVDDNNKILSIGYNGFPGGCSDNNFPWKSEVDENNDSDEEKVNIKDFYVVHAELNAILNYKGESLKGTTIYTTLYPCNECTKAIIQAGIKKIVYFQYKDSIKNIATKRMLEAAGVEIEKYE